MFSDFTVAVMAERSELGQIELFPASGSGDSALYVLYTELVKKPLFPIFFFVFFGSTKEMRRKYRALFWFCTGRLGFAAPARLDRNSEGSRFEAAPGPALHSSER